jgi:precorrin-6B methylase 2
MRAARKTLSAAEREDRFHGLLAGAAGVRLLESVAALELPRLLVQRGPLTTEEIVVALGLHPHRGRKWVALLCHLGLLEPAPRLGSPPPYRAGPLMRAFFHADGTLLWFYQDFLRYFRNVLNYDFVGVLRGLPVPQVPYPPRELEDVEALEAWMRTTTGETIKAIERAVNLRGVRRLLDVAGGDGTMAVHYARRHPRLHVTVFNLPASAKMVRRNAEKAGLSDRIDVVEGDFRRDPLPRGYQMVQFSRVLADWPEDVCRMLLGKARESLLPGGKVVICEPLADENPALMLSWHFSYVPYDDFGVELYKHLDTYQRLLTGLGFRLLQIKHRSDDSIHAVIVAQRKKSNPRRRAAPTAKGKVRGK